MAKLKRNTAAWRRGAASKSKQDVGKEMTSPSKQEGGKETASTLKQEAGEPLRKEDKGVDEASQGVEAEVAESGKDTASTSKQEAGDPLRNEDNGVDEASQGVEEEVEYDDTDMHTDEDEEAAAARWNNDLAAKLGMILALVETKTGFAIFMYDGRKLLQKDALQDIWVEFADHVSAKSAAYLLKFCPFESKTHAITSLGVSDELADMIRRCIEPGQKLAVENKFYQDVIQNCMEISCLCDDTVNELMWGLKVQMPYLLPAEESMLDEMDCFPMSKGMEQLLKSNSFILEPKDMRVTRNIIYVAGVVRQCDRSVSKHEYSLRSAAEHLKRISNIDTHEWDLMKLATAMKMICCPEEKIPAASLLFPSCVRVKLRMDAPKYEGKILKETLLIMHKEMYTARRTRVDELRKLSRLLCQKETIKGVIVQLTECNKSCNIRQSPPTHVPADVLRRYTCISSHQLHRTDAPGILSMHIHPSKDIVATGGIDTNAVFFHRPSGKILCKLTGHSKKITTLKFVNGDGLFLTGSADETVRIWHGSEYGNYSCRHVLKDHTDEVVAVTVQAGEKYFVSASKDNSWCQYDISTASCVSKDVEPSVLGGYTSVSFHPHGPLLGTGTTTAHVKIWDMNTKSHVANLKGHFGPVTAMSFSENGYLLATAASDGVRLWDVRKLKVLRTISHDLGTTTNTAAVEFDSSGSYLGIGGSDARLYEADKAEWNIIKTLPDLSGTGKVTSLKFGANAKYIAVGSMDCDLRIFGFSEDEQMEV